MPPSVLTEGSDPGPGVSLGSTGSADAPQAEPRAAAPAPHEGAAEPPPDATVPEPLLPAVVPTATEPPMLVFPAAPAKPAVEPATYPPVPQMPAPRPSTRRRALVAWRGSSSDRRALALGGLVGAALIAYVVARFVSPSSGDAAPSPPRARPDPAPELTASAPHAAGVATPSPSAVLDPAVSVPAAAAPPSVSPTVPEQTPDGGPGGLKAARELTSQARRLAAQRNTAQAERLYLQALRLEPLYVPAVEGLARLHLGRRDARSALYWAKRAVKLRPGAAGLHLLLGDALAASGDQRAAEREWRIALRKNPHLHEAERRLARTSTTKTR